MKRLFILTIILIGFCAAASGASRIKRDSVFCHTMNTEIQYNVYLPDGYVSDGSVTYPVVYLLHGLSDNCEAWVSKGTMKPIADELIESGEACKMVIVMPQAGDADTRRVPCGYFNMPAWSYEDLFFDEFIPDVESKYHAGGDKMRRAVMGLSMSGGGSTVYCQKHPDMFSSCYAMSAWMDEPKAEGVTYAEAKDWREKTCISVHENSAPGFLRKADAQTIEALKTVKWFIDCGDDDFLFDVNVETYQLMKKAGIKTEFRVRNGIHNWEYWRTSLRAALPFASRNFSK